ncbi:sulfatase [Nocardioides sp. R-C-SC26]|uniref:sulfatase family protein n=1 Tax=Nocardioides sp. R-C-SC26 TaxID=2870414 RepID=UPI001E481180|nr:sulfatase [Nocardioides sp. R-C-SC26]
MHGRRTTQRAALAVAIAGLAVGTLAAFTGAPSSAEPDRSVVSAASAVIDPVGTAAPGRPNGDQFTGKRPNIILITTDDQASSDMRWMPKTVQNLGRAGVTFSRALSPHPLCCPARAAILTGQYAQNNGVKSNQDPFNFKALKISTTLPVWLNRVGYNTAFTGKYLNGYGTHGKPQPGWDYWDASMINPYSYVGYEMYQNGNPQWYKKLNNVDYINMRVDKLVREYSADDKPFFIWASHVAPHGRLDKVKNIPSTAEALPPRRFQRMFSGVNSPSLRDPGYTSDRISDKNSLVQRKNRPTTQKINTVFRSRIRSLQAVDQGIAELVRTLRSLGELDNTYIIFTSDNGFLLGEHNLITKNVPYRQSLRVPMIVRGPGVPAGAVRSQRALMIDVAPTIADLAGAKPLIPVDGVSLVPAAVDNAPLRETVLIQAGPQTPADLSYGWWWRGVTTDRYTYARFFANGLEELYDHLHDPSEINNVAKDPRYADVLAELRRRTKALVTCSTSTQCSQKFDAMPGPS